MLGIIKRAQPQQQNISNSKQQSFAWKRVLSDNVDLKTDMPKSIVISYPDPDDIMNFDVTILPDENYWKGGKFPFSIIVPDEYPIQPPKVLSKKVIKKVKQFQKIIFHPNIDLEGKVCLNILREDWKPVSQLKDVMFGLLYLFIQPNPTDPLNKKAAELMLSNQQNFAYMVNRAMKGEVMEEVKYDRVI